MAHDPAEFGQHPGDQAQQPRITLASNVNLYDSEGKKRGEVDPPAPLGINSPSDFPNQTELLLAFGVYVDGAGVR